MSLTTETSPSPRLRQTLRRENTDESTSPSLPIIPEDEHDSDSRPSRSRTTRSLHTSSPHDISSTPALLSSSSSSSSSLNYSSPVVYSYPSKGSFLLDLDDSDDKAHTHNYQSHSEGVGSLLLPLLIGIMFLVTLCGLASQTVAQDRANVKYVGWGMESDGKRHWRVRRLADIYPGGVEIPPRLVSRSSTDHTESQIARSAITTIHMADRGVADVDI